MARKNGIERRNQIIEAAAVAADMDHVTSTYRSLLDEIGSLSPIQDFDDWSGGSNDLADFGPIPD